MESVVTSLPRRERERLARRAEMLVAAQEVFAEKGYTDATLDEVASRAEYGKGTLYNYFPGGKQEILLAIVEQFHDELCERIAATFGQRADRPFRDALRDFFEHTFQFFLDRTELFLTLLREAHRIGFSDDPAPREFFAKQRARALDALSIPLEQAMAPPGGGTRLAPARLADRASPHRRALGDGGERFGGAADVGRGRHRAEAETYRARRVRADRLVGQRRAVHAGARQQAKVRLQHGG